jgi:hypothetical protein
MIGVPYNPAQCCFLLSQSLNANQFDPNVPNTGVTPHNLLWNFVENKLQWVETLVGGIIVQELGATLFPDRKIITVDATYGNNTTAATNPYNTEFAFSTLDAAITAAVAGDLISVNPGNYSPVANLFKDKVDWYFNPGAIVTKADTIFNANGVLGNVSFNVLGYGDFTSTGFATPIFFLRSGASANVTAQKLTVGNSFYGAAYVEINSNLVINVIDKIDASFNRADAFYVDNNSNIVVNTPEVRFSRAAYIVGINSTIIANVDRTVAYDIASDFTQFGTSSAIIYAFGASGPVRSTITINGDLVNKKTSQSPEPANQSGALNILGADGDIFLNTISESTTLGLRAVNINNGDARVFINGNLTELNGNGAVISAVGSGYLSINGRLSSQGVNIVGLGDGGNVILDKAILVNNTGAATINGSASIAGISFLNYGAYFNTAPDPVGFVDLLGIPPVVNPLVK